MLAQFKTLPQLIAGFPTEQTAIDHLAAIRWADGLFCPHCGCADQAKVKRMSTTDKESGEKVQTNQYKCYACREKFNVRVGTIFQDTKLPLRTWYAAIWLITNHPKGIASTTLATDLGITQKTAWFVLHRLRHAARTPSFNAPLGGNGPVEVDEKAVGGRDKNRHASKRKGITGMSGKTIVMGIVERGGELRAGTVDDTRSASLEPIVNHHVVEGAAVYTDEARAYQHLHMGYDHQTVRHSAGEYVRGDAHTNTIESVWALLQRQIMGIHHWVSPKHLDQYVAEMTFRFNRRELDKADRVNGLLAQIEGP
ncbi:MAG TPA: IS1595 family transposase, partial [Caulobacteraceae bacterium]|nr:IS1595 family transposase [Caulobacteraceae bacterium]